MQAAATMLQHVEATLCRIVHPELLMNNCSVPAHGLKYWLCFHFDTHLMGIRQGIIRLWNMQIRSGMSQNSKSTFEKHKPLVNQTLCSSWRLICFPLDSTLSPASHWWDNQQLKWYYSVTHQCHHWLHLWFCDCIAEWVMTHWPFMNSENIIHSLALSTQSTSACDHSWLYA